jgi:hypothetical protein
LGDIEEYFQIIINFEMMNNTFASKGIPIIINEVGVLTEQKKDRINQRIFVYNISISLYFDGIMPCL